MADLKLEVTGSRPEKDARDLNLNIIVGDKAEMGGRWLSVSSS